MIRFWRARSSWSWAWGHMLQQDLFQFWMIWSLGWNHWRRIPRKQNWQHNLFHFLFSKMLFFGGWGWGGWDLEDRTNQEESHKWERKAIALLGAFQPEWLAVFGHEEEASKNNWWAEFAVRSNFSSRGLACGAVGQAQALVGKGVRPALYLLIAL